MHCSLPVGEHPVEVEEGVHKVAARFADHRGSDLADPGFVGRLAYSGSGADTAGHSLAVAVDYNLDKEAVGHNRRPHRNHFAGHSQEFVGWVDDHSSVGIDFEAGTVAVRVRAALRIGPATIDLEEQRHCPEIGLQQDPFHQWYRTMDQ